MRLLLCFDRPQKSLIQWLFIWINAYDECKWLLRLYIFGNNTIKNLLGNHLFARSKWLLLMRWMLLGASQYHFLFRSVHLRFIVVHYSLPGFRLGSHSQFLICDLFKWPLSSYFGNYAVRWIYIKWSGQKGLTQNEIGFFRWRHSRFHRWQLTSGQIQCDGIAFEKLLTQIRKEN